MSIPPRHLPGARIHIAGIPDELDEEITRGVLTSDVLSRSTVDLSQFKNEHGEFKQWLQIFYKANRRTFRETYLKVTTVLPWCSDQTEVDVEFHRAIQALEGYSKYPLNWRSFSWRIKPLLTSPVYGVFCRNPSRESFYHKLSETGYNPTQLHEESEQEFWDLMKKFVLVPRADGALIPVITTIDYGVEHDENSGLGEAGADSLRER